jgi:hypothetical protein
MGQAEYDSILDPNDESTDISAWETLLSDGRRWRVGSKSQRME